jgi:hypothetical protein
MLARRCNIAHAAQLPEPHRVLWHEVRDSGGPCVGAGEQCLEAAVVFAVDQLRAGGA